MCLLVNVYIMISGTLLTGGFYSIMFFFGGMIFHINRMLNRLDKEFRHLGRESNGEKTLRQQFLLAIDMHRGIMECVVFGFSTNLLFLILIFVFLSNL